MLTAKAQPLDKMISLHVAGVTDSSPHHCNHPAVIPAAA